MESGALHRPRGKIAAGESTLTATRGATGGVAVTRYFAASRAEEGFNIIVHRPQGREDLAASSRTAR